MNKLVKKIERAVHDADDQDDLAFDLVSMLEDEGEEDFCDAIAACLLAAHGDDEDEEPERDYE